MAQRLENISFGAEIMSVFAKVSAFVVHGRPIGPSGRRLPGQNAAVVPFNRVNSLLSHAF